MERKTEGAWVLHHMAKLQHVTGTTDFDVIDTAGKCGMVLSNLAASETGFLNHELVTTIAKLSGIKPLEIRGVIDKLVEQRLVVRDGNEGVHVLGVTNTSILEHTSTIYRELEPNNIQNAALTLSELVSDSPKNYKLISEYVSDIHKLSSADLSTLFSTAELTEIIDYEKIDNEKVYFNGNLFRKGNIDKTNKVLSTLKEHEVRIVTDLNDSFKNSGFVSLDEAIKITGEPLLSKLHSIGMYDFNEVSNSKEAKTFLTMPAAFSKYGQPFEDDALDLAKAFVASLAYGMNYSQHNRGRIVRLPALLSKLIAGHEVGPATAIGEDYRVLELKRVVQIKYDSHGRFYMKLLKKEVGELALQVLLSGDATEQAVINLVSGKVVDYTGPEATRAIARKKQGNISNAQVMNALRVMRSSLS